MEAQAVTYPLRSPFFFAAFALSRQRRAAARRTSFEFSSEQSREHVRVAGATSSLAIGISAPQMVQVMIPPKDKPPCCALFQELIGKAGK